MAALALLALLALLPPPLIGSSGSAVGGASSSALCDTALDSVCGSVRGAGSACTSCQTTFSHQVILHGAGCAPADLTGFCAAGINPQHSSALTVYHVYPSAGGGGPGVGGPGGGTLDIADKNTADLGGMIFFDLRSLGNPVECAEPNLPGTSTPDPTVTFDCTNAETHADPSIARPLHITQLELEVDQRWGDYAFCNICLDGYDPYGAKNAFSRAICFGPEPVLAK
jgi:hypothetical protein